MAQAIVIREDQKASVALGMLYSDGSVQQLGLLFNYAFDPEGIATLAVGSPTFIVASAPGTTVLTLSDINRTFSEDVQVTVTAGPPVVVPVGLSIVLGAPEPK
jgi:hypothetical protein